MTTDDQLLVTLTVADLRRLVREEVAALRNPQPEQPSQWVDVATAAERYACTPQTIRNWIRAGAPARQIGTAEHPQFRIHLEQFDAWMEALHARRKAR